VIAGIRPEDLTIASGDGGIAARVELVEPLGNETLVHWSSPVGTLVSRITAGRPPALAEQATLAARPAGIHLFDAESGAALGGAAVSATPR